MRSAQRHFTSAFICVHLCCRPSVLLGIALATLVACDQPLTTKTDYQMWLERHPQDSEAHWQLADLLLQERDYQGAEHHYRTALSINPRTVDAWVGLGNISCKQGLYEQAESHFRNALSLDE